MFIHSYVAPKIEKKKKMEEKVTMRLKRFQIIDWWWDLISLNDASHCKETTTCVKECEKNIECKKEIPNLAYKQGLLFEKSKEPGKVYKRLVLVKVLQKYPKLDVLMNFK